MVSVSTRAVIVPLRTVISSRIDPNSGGLSFSRTVPPPELIDWNACSTRWTNRTRSAWATTPDFGAPSEADACDGWLADQRPAAPTGLGPSLVAGFPAAAASVALVLSAGPVFVEAGESPSATAVAAVWTAAATLDAIAAVGGGICAAGTAAAAKTLSIADAASAPLGS